VATIALVGISVVIAIGLPAVTAWRFRTPQRRRDAWLSANAQPRLTIVGRVAMAFTFVVAGLSLAIAATVLDSALSWAVVSLCVGGLLSTGVLVVVSTRTPHDLN
jgi:hypothetical protein